jgi:DNA-binding GntR family transcriptional regulator
LKKKSTRLGNNHQAIAGWSILASDNLKGAVMLLKPFEPTGKVVLADELFEYLRDAILSGDLEVGERLVEESIAQVTSVSRTPVREAIRKLSAAGLAENTGRSFVVAELSQVELQEVWAVMENLQVLAARLAARNRSDIDLMNARYLMERGAEAAETGDSARVVALNRQFHDAINQASGNRFLAKEIAELRMRLERSQDFTGARQRGGAQLEHVSVWEAVRDGNADAAEQSVREHLQHQLEATVASWSLPGSS